MQLEALKILLNAINKGLKVNMINKQLRKVQFGQKTINGLNLAKKELKNLTLANGTQE